MVYFFFMVIYHRLSYYHYKRFHMSKGNELATQNLCVSQFKLEGRIYPRGIYVLQVIHFEGLRSGESSVTSTNAVKPV